METPSITTSLLTNNAYGFPNGGDARRIAPLLLACIHMTSNSNNLDDNAATNERNYANRVGSVVSAHYYINRNGSAIQAIDPVKYAAWSNGAIVGPRTSQMGYKIVKGVYTDEGFNANEAFLLEIECVAYSTTYPITLAQKNTIAWLFATYSASQNIAINRSTVLGHSDLNTTNRLNDPVPATQLEAFLKEIIGLANTYKQEFITDPLTDRIYDLNNQVNQLTSTTTAQNQRIIDLENAQIQLGAELDQCTTRYNTLAKEKDDLQNNYNDLMNRYLAAESIVSIYKGIKQSWDYIHKAFETS